jgi:HD-like signal output (HDOD) protein
MKTPLNTLRSQQMREILGNEVVRRIAGGVDKLPSLPETYSALCRAASDPKPDISEIARLIALDPAISLRVLQLVNSAFFGLTKRIMSVQKAVEVLGPDMLKGLILSAQIGSAQEMQPTPSFSMSVFQSYSNRVGRLARTFAGDSALADDAFTAGTMLGVGQVVLALREPAIFERVLHRIAETGESQYKVELELLGTTHAEIGAFLLSTWGLPYSIVDCVAFHYCPSRLAPGDDALLALVHAADALVGIIACREPEEKLDRAFLDRAGVLAALPRWRELAEAACEHVL